MKTKVVVEFLKFCEFFFYYLKKKVIISSVFFEENKNALVRLFIIKRGKYSRPFLHFAAMGVMATGVVVAPFLAQTYPIFSSQSQNTLEISSPASQKSIIVGNDVFQTSVSEKPRDKVINYTVERGDTLSTIAQKFGISIDTIRWANDLTNDNIAIGDELKILPVSGIEHKVAKGESIYSIAKKLDTDPQKIVDFPFNDFANPETFSLVEGQKLIIPDGVKPSVQPFIKRSVYIAQGPVSVSSAGFTWPLQGVVTQFASWYHMALDIAASLGTPIVTAQDGVVTSISMGTWDGGYGTSIWITSANGLDSHYAHLSGVNVSIGDKVAAGKSVIGWIGMTGRTTGPHLHFEVRRNGSLVNPMAYLQ